MHPQSSRADVVIVGGGVTGAALYYVLSRFSNVGSVQLLERRDRIADVSSGASHNSQTLHVGDIETNYTRDKAERVKAAAELIVGYADRLKAEGGDASFLRAMQKMVLAVGSREVDELTARAATLTDLYPQARMLDADGIREREPKVMEGRDPAEQVAAYASDDGYAVDFGRLAASFIAQGREGFAVRTGIDVTAMRRDGEGYALTLSDGTVLRAGAVVVSAGGASLAMAQAMGLGRDLTLLPVAGDFFTAPNVLRGKVYTMQAKGLPFAAVHGDPDVNDSSQMRFGPIAIATPVLEPGRWRSVVDFLRVFRPNVDTLASVVKVNTDPVVLRFVSRHALYYLPWVGKRFFLREARKIVPTIRAGDLRFGHGMGGVRPQVADVKTRALLLGEAKLRGDRAIFNITPSPGASVCLQTACDDARQLADWLGDGCRFDEDAFRRATMPAYATGIRA